MPPAVHGIKKNRNFGKKAVKFDGSFEAAHHRHGKIKNDQIGPGIEGFGDGFAAVGSFCAHFDILAGKQDGTNAAADGVVIIGDKSFDIDKFLLGMGRAWPECRKRAKLI